jgi:hypothetical protein
MATFTSNEDVINAYQNEPVLWDTIRNATEEEKELAWRRICDLFNLKSAGKYIMIRLWYVLVLMYVIYSVSAPFSEGPLI